MPFSALTTTVLVEPHLHELSRSKLKIVVSRESLVPDHIGCNLSVPVVARISGGGRSPSGVDKVTALYAVVMAPRDHEATIAWRRENPSAFVDTLGCDAVACLHSGECLAQTAFDSLLEEIHCKVDHAGFYLILCTAAVAGH